MTANPIQTFQKLNKDDVRQLAVAIAEPWMQRSIMAALAQIATMNLNNHQLYGANIFLHVFRQLTVEAGDLKDPAMPTLATYDMANLHKIEEEARRELQKGPQ